jgi:hypothetical protein
MNIRVQIITLFFVFLFISCTDTEKNNDTGVAVEETSREEEDNDGCKFDDGMHDAMVDYYNPSTGHSATYSLEVEVENCEVTVIHFPSGGWLDDSHISPAELNEDGDAELEDEEGRTFSVHIDN